MLHWQGGDHTRLEVVKNRTGQHRWKTDTATEELISRYPLRFARDSPLEEAVTSEPVSGKRPEIPSQEGKIRRWVRDRIRRKTGPLPVAQGTDVTTW
jgi:hypothetical protein